MAQDVFSARKRLGILWSTMFFGMLLRLPSINYCLAPDEAYSFDYYVRRGPTGFFFEWYQCNNQPLSSFLTWITFELFGEADWIMRLPAFLFGLGTILFVGHMARVMFKSDVVGVLAALLLTLNPYHIAYSSNFRSYTAVMFFALLSSYLLYRNLNRPHWLLWTGIALATWAMAFNHIVSMIMLAGSALILGLYFLAICVNSNLRTGKNFWAFASSSMGFTLGAVLICIAYSPVFFLPTAVFARVTTGEWPESAVGFISGAEQEEWHPFPRFAETVTALTGVPFVIATAVALLGLVFFLRKKRWGSGVVLAALAGPIIGLLVVDLKIEPRYSMTLLPYFTIGLAAGLVALWQLISLRSQADAAPSRKIVAMLAPGLVAIVLLCYMSPLYLRDFPHAAPTVVCIFNDRKSAVEYISAEMSPEDVVAYPPNESSPTEHYVSRLLQPDESTLASPPKVEKIWFVASTPESLRDHFPAMYGATEAKIFHGATVYGATLEDPNFVRHDISPLKYSNPGSGSATSHSWVYQLFIQEAGVLGIWEREEAAPRLIDIRGDLECTLVGPSIAVPGGRSVVYRARMHTQADPGNLALELRFYSDDETMLDLRRIRLHPGDAPMPDFKWFEMTALAPIGTTNVVPVIKIMPSRTPKVAITVETVEFWVDDRPALSAVPSSRPG